MKADELAIWLHDNYEDIALTMGWDTQKSTKVGFEKLPASNKATMIELSHRIIALKEKELAIVRRIDKKTINKLEIEAIDLRDTNLEFGEIYDMQIECIENLERFIKWYSGMGQSKIDSAFNRFRKELLNKL